MGGDKDLIQSDNSFLEHLVYNLEKSRILNEFNDSKFKLFILF